MKTKRHVSVLYFVILFGPMIFLYAQAPDDPSTAAPAIVDPSPSPTPNPISKRNFFKNIASDQKAIWLSPFHLREKDLKWLAPFVATEAGLIATDRRTSSWVSRNGSLPVVSRDVSLLGSTYGTVGFVGGFYLIGRATHNDHAKETGELAAESLIDTAIVTEVIKFTIERMRPNDGMGRGTFFTHGSSFPSGHSSSSWAVATVIAYEYHDHPWVKYGAFAVAAAISMSRYSGRNHFLSDILAGAAIGFGTGRYVYHARHIKTPAGVDKGPDGTFNWIPRILPYYDRKTLTYGGRLTWGF